MQVQVSLTLEISATASISEMEQRIQEAGQQAMREALKQAIRQCPRVAQRAADTNSRSRDYSDTRLLKAPGPSSSLFSGVGWGALSQSYP